MQMPSKNKTYEFGDFRLDTRMRRFARKTGECINLAPKVFDLLLVMVESGGRVVSKNELLDTIWADAVVEEGNLTQTIFLLRKALGETSREPRYILTVPQHGYRFIGQVKEFDVEEGVDFSETKTEASSVKDNELPSNAEVESSKAESNAGNLKKSYFRGQPPYALPAALLILLGVFVSIGFYRQKSVPTASDASKIKTLAVLPFEWRDAPPDKTFFADGLTENLIYNLSRSPTVRVISYQAVSRYTGNETDLYEFARSLNADAVITGHIANQTADEVQIKIEIDRVRDKTQLWGRLYAVRLAELSPTQHRIAHDVAAQLNDKNSLPAKAETSDYEAYNFYLAGRHFLNKRTAQNLRKAIENFQSAIERDPNFFAPHSGLAVAYAVSPTYGVAPPLTSCPQAKQAAERALTLNENADEASTLR